MRAHSPDPFRSMLAPALRDDPEAARAALAALPPDADDPHRATAARTFWALGEPTAARRALEHALALGGSHADALASVARPDPSASIGRRLIDADPAIRADAACDLAWRRLKAGDRAAATRAVEHALQLSPHHAEARHWWDWLQSASDPIGATAAIIRGEPAPRDARALCPRPQLGWLSPERWWRRIVGGLWSRPAPGGTALRRLQRWGVVSRALASDPTYARLPFAHPRALAERALDRAQSRARQGRSPGDAAAEAWGLVGRVAPEALAPMARALARLGADHPSAAPTGLVAVETLRQLEPHRCSWPAARARILAHLHRPRAARAEARAVLRRSDLHGPALADAVHALAISGMPDEARDATRRACRTPGLADAAERLLAVRPRSRSLDPRRPPPARQNTPQACRPLRRLASSTCPGPGSSTS